MGDWLHLVVLLLVIFFEGGLYQYLKMSQRFSVIRCGSTEAKGDAPCGGGPPRDLPFDHFLGLLLNQQTAYEVTQKQKLQEPKARQPQRQDPALHEQPTRPTERQQQAASK